MTMTPKTLQTPEFRRSPLTVPFCNLERLFDSLEQRNLDGVVVSTSYNVFYLSGFQGIAHKSDEPRPYAVILSRHSPEHPILILADYYVGSLTTQPTWINDVRSFRGVMLPLDLASKPDDIDRFVPNKANDAPWLPELRSNFHENIGDACRHALGDLGLTNSRIAFDELRFGHQLSVDGVEIVDGYDPLMYARSVKTSQEIGFLQRATRLNQMAIERTVSTWSRGMSWRELNHTYHQNAVGMGGFVRDPGAMVWGHPRGGDAAITLQTGLEDFEVETGLHILFDCHGTLDSYCWDGGKTWVVDSEPNVQAKPIARATEEVAGDLLNAMRPGIKVSELQARGRSVFRKAGVPDADTAIIFFHGLGLSHMDLEQVSSEGIPNADWALEEGMVVPLHVLYPGDENNRMWIEEVAHVTTDGATPFFSWGLNPLIG